MPMVLSLRKMKDHIPVVILWLIQLNATVKIIVHMVAIFTSVARSQELVLSSTTKPLRNLNYGEAKTLNQKHSNENCCVCILSFSSLWSTSSFM
jgi:hypothetical protein